MGSTLSELRKEIAHKLAAIGSSFEMQQEQQIYTPMGFLAFVTLDDAKAEPIEVMAALSDLIDPTCEDLYSDDKTHAWQFKCSSCGSTLDCMDDNGESTIQLDGVAQGVSYCPHCGARVVEE